MHIKCRYFCCAHQKLGRGELESERRKCTSGKYSSCTQNVYFGRQLSMLKRQIFQCKSNDFYFILKGTLAYPLHNMTFFRISCEITSVIPNVAKTLSKWIMCSEIQGLHQVPLTRGEGKCFKKYIQKIWSVCVWRGGPSTEMSTQICDVHSTPVEVL